MAGFTVNHKQTYDIDGILFDKDGTLIEFSSLWVTWAKRFIDTIISKARLLQDDKRVLANTIGFEYDLNTWDLKGPLCIGTPDELITICALHVYKRGFGWDEALELVTHAVHDLEQDDDWKQTIKSVNGLNHLLQAAASYSLKLGVVTSDNHQQARQHLKTLGFETYFHSITGSDQVKRGKPFPDMVYKACRDMDVKPERTIIIGDSNGDMMLGKNSNTMAGVGITAEFNSSDHLKDADHIIEDYHSILIHEINRKGDLLT